MTPRGGGKTLTIHLTQEKGTDAITFTVQIKNIQPSNSSFEVQCGQETVTLSQNQTHGFTMKTDEENDIYCYAITNSLGSYEPIIGVTFDFPSDGTEYHITESGGTGSSLSGVCECTVDSSNSATIKHSRDLDYNEEDVSSNFEFRVYRKNYERSLGYFYLYVEKKA